MLDVASQPRIDKAIRQMRAHYSTIRARWITELTEHYTDEFVMWPDAVIDAVMADVISSDEPPSIASLRRMAQSHRPPSGVPLDPAKYENIATPAEARAAMRGGMMEYWDKKHGDEPLPAKLDDLPGAQYLRVLTDPYARAKALAIHGDRDPFAA